MADRLNISTFDNANKPTAMSVPCAAAITGPQAIAVADAVEAIIKGVAPGAIQSSRTVHQAPTAGPSQTVGAKRGNKWLLTIGVALDKGGDGDVYTYEIGTADDSVTPSATDDFLDLTAGVGLALKTAIEAVYESDEGNPGVLQAVQQVNRGLN